MRGRAEVEGVAIGRAIVWAGDPAPREQVGSIEEERTRLMRAMERAIRGVRDLARRLPPAEAELLEPEVSMLVELGPAMLACVEDGERPEDAVRDATSRLSTDLLDDARARLLDGLAHNERSVEARLDGRVDDMVLVTEVLTPSVVAALPAHVVGIVAASDGAAPVSGGTSHAAILARTRDIPLVFLRARAARLICEDDEVVLDAAASAARVWIAPPTDLVDEARERHAALAHRRAEQEADVAAPLSHLRVRVHVNVGSLDDRIPSNVEGIGLVRTELVFSDRASAPSETEQFAVLCALAARIGDVPLTVRLFDAGGDKSLAWLTSSSPGDARGTALLLTQPAVLDTQLRALARAAQHAHVRVMLPLVASAEQVRQVRARCHVLAVGAMVETPQAVDRIVEIAAVSDFVSIGTNDLSAALTGQRRASSTLSFDRRLLQMIARVVEAAHAHGREVSVCGEMAGDPHGARLLVGLGVDTLSVATTRLASAKLSLRDVTIDDCRRVARETLG